MSDYLPVLPDEVVAATILWRLLVKSIIQCRCVCKSWYSLITSPNFISTHFIRKTLTLNPQILLNNSDKPGTCLLIFDYEDYLQSMSFHLPRLSPNPDIRIDIVGTVNGLICFSIGQGCDNFILCNPSIGKFQSISLPNSSSPVRWYPVRGFGFDERTQDYKILLIISDKDGFIYSMNSNCWRRITCPVPKNWVRKCSSVVFVNGSFHWLSRNGVIMVFDVKSEAFGYISLPKCMNNFQYKPCEFMEFGESSIAIFQFGCNYIWIMKEYGSVESWMKLTLAPGKMFLGFINKYEVLVLIYGINKRILSQKINNRKFEPEEVKKMTYDEVSKMIDSDGTRISFSTHKYLPSLVLLDKENNIDVAAPTYRKLIKTV